jgi:hypothetical protein
LLIINNSSLPNTKFPLTFCRRYTLLLHSTNLTL